MKNSVTREIRTMAGDAGGEALNALTTKMNRTAWVPLR